MVAPLCQRWRRPPATPQKQQRTDDSFAEVHDGDEKAVAAPRSQRNPPQPATACRWQNQHKPPKLSLKPSSWIDRGAQCFGGGGNCTPPPRSSSSMGPPPFLPEFEVRNTPEPPKLSPDPPFVGGVEKLQCSSEIVGGQLSRFS